MTYVTDERVRAAQWKQATDTLPAEAKVPAAYMRGSGGVGVPLYDFCVPAQYAKLSLLPEVRATALELFSELAISWHFGVGTGPSNHLLSSQVQCVNALAQMVREPDRLIRAFGGMLGISKVLQIEPGRFLTFEYIGPTDYFGEAPKGVRTRGANCTSVDAAFLCRTTTGHTELILLEWKYTESYSARKPNISSDAVRKARYFDQWSAEGGSLLSSLVGFEDVLQEPFYQLVRQQLLAQELERHHACGADRVRVLHVLSPANTAYQRSIRRPGLLAIGGTVSEAWTRLLRTPDRFLSVDSGLFLDPNISSQDYAARYGPAVVGRVS
jgi:hypothetical protein